MKTTDPTKINFKEKFDLSGKVVIISGSCGLIGKAFCEAAGQFGAHVVAADIEQANPEKFATDLSERNKVKCLGFSLNVADKSSVIKLKEFVLKEYGRI